MRGKLHAQHGRDHRYYSADPVRDYDWITVGTLGVDGVDTYIAENPEPYDTATIPFQNGWHWAGVPWAPVSFVLTHNGWVHMRGAFTGGADGTVVFTLPTRFRPAFQQSMNMPTTSTSHYCTALINTDGTVVFGTTV